MSASQARALVELFIEHLRIALRSDPAGVSGSARGGIVLKAKLHLAAQLGKVVTR